MGLVDEALPDALTLVGRVDRQIGQVAAVGEVSHCSRDADKATAIASGHNEVRIAKHRVETRKIVGGPPFGEGRGNQDSSKLLCGQLRLQVKQNPQALCQNSLA